MPLTRIIVQKEHYSRNELNKISHILHAVLVNEFDVPVRDQFQIIEEVEKNNIIVDREYLSPGRTSGYILFYITAGKPRNLTQKTRFYRELCLQLTKQTSIRSADIMVIIQYTDASDWSFSNGDVFSTKMLEG
ncbi:tautomerase family protein [Vibrio viridaestus]|uniref:Tautomerase family protein n=1 Tax=Vibrio viridaestus TaxID=2487322 RepID=A0A3N9TI06_9VIBR|nr:tautomerase family protein [Vibrio viridaestus]RQW63534.1 tautomerase family protein [Vibrio viridaestus]